jgi:hypothetical protein
VKEDEGDEMLGTRTTAAIATAAVAVVLGILAGAVVLLRDDDQGSLQRGPIVVTPSGPTSSAPSSEPATVLDELPHGAAPAIGYVEDHVYVAPGGRRTPLPRDRGISAVTPLGQRFLIADTRVFEGSIVLALVDRSGARVDEWCSSGAPVVSADRLRTAWVTFPCLESLETGVTQVHRARTDHPGAGRASQHVGRRAPITVVGFLGDDVVVDGAWEERGYLTDLVSAPRPITGLTWLRSVDEVGGLVAGQRGTDGEQAVVLDPRTGVHRWQAPHVYLGEFSPDGSLIPGQDRDGWSVFDRNGRVRYSLSLPRGAYLSSMAWENERRLLAVVTTPAKIAIVRFSAVGRAELATPVTRYDPNDPAYVLAARP